MSIIDMYSEYLGQSNNNVTSKYYDDHSDYGRDYDDHSDYGRDRDEHSDWDWDEPIGHEDDYTDERHDDDYDDERHDDSHTDY